MHIALKITLATLTAAVLAAGAAAGWYFYTKLPVRSGTLQLQDLADPVFVRYDERGVPHIKAKSELDMYRALGYVHAQDRLFQMELMRRLALGELSEILGPDLLDTDKLFRTLGIRARAETVAAALDPASPSTAALLAYLDGINQYQASKPAPMEFDALNIPKRPFTPRDTLAVAGYLAYSFAAAFKTEPVLTYVRDTLGPDYLRAFDVDWHPQGVLRGTNLATAPSARQLSQATYATLDHVAQVADSAMALAGVPSLNGSNAWVISGRRTASGKPLLAGDPHIAFSAPATWYEAHLQAPNFELYGHFMALNPMALLGHNEEFGWSLTMFQNDDIDLIAEKANPSNPNEVWHQDQWVALQTRMENIKVKGQADVQLMMRTSPHGPIITDAFSDTLGTTPVAMWWAFLQTENPLIDAFYALNRADTRAKARAAAETIHAPGLNILWASESGDIAWWAAAKLPIRPVGINPAFILDATPGQAEKTGYYHFNFNPQEENPMRGYIVSANQQPKPPSGVPVPGYYNVMDRAQRLDDGLREPDKKWDIPSAQALQLHVGNDYGPRIVKELMPILKAVTTDPFEKTFLEPLEQWNGEYTRDSIAALLFSQMLYELSKAAMADELGEARFNSLLKTRALDSALPLLAADANSPWWDDVRTKTVESRFETIRITWVNTIKHLKTVYGDDLQKWNWGEAHSLTHVHLLGRQKPLDRFFNVGPFAVPGARETPNNFSSDIGPAPWSVIEGPSTRRVIDFANPGGAVGINPLGQSGVLFDAHYDDQALQFVEGSYVPQHLTADDVKANTRSTLKFVPRP